jgi:hypothetical protein
MPTPTRLNNDIRRRKGQTIAHRSPSGKARMHNRLHLGRALPKNEWLVAYCA